MEVRNVQQQWDENEERKLVYFLFLPFFFFFWQMAFSFKSHQISFFSKARLFCDVVETCQFLVSCCRLKGLSDTNPGSVIQPPWELLQGIVAGISEALHGNRDLGRSDLDSFTPSDLHVQSGSASEFLAVDLWAFVNYHSWASAVIRETCLMPTPPHCCLTEMVFMLMFHWWCRARRPSAGL